jgi:hypothetical protein
MAQRLRRERRKKQPTIPKDINEAAELLMESPEYRYGFFFISPIKNSNLSHHLITVFIGRHLKEETSSWIGFPRLRSPQQDKQLCRKLAPVL